MRVSDITESKLLDRVDRYSYNGRVDRRRSGMTTRRDTSVSNAEGLRREC